MLPRMAQYVTHSSLKDTIQTIMQRIHSSRESADPCLRNSISVKFVHSNARNYIFQFPPHQANIIHEVYFDSPRPHASGKLTQRTKKKGLDHVMHGHILRSAENYKRKDLETETLTLVMSFTTTFLATVHFHQPFLWKALWGTALLGDADPSPRNSSMFKTLWDVKEPPHHSQRVGHGRPGVLVCSLSHKSLTILHASPLMSSIA